MTAPPQWQRTPPTRGKSSLLRWRLPAWSASGYVATAAASPGGSTTGSVLRQRKEQYSHCSPERPPRRQGRPLLGLQAPCPLGGSPWYLEAVAVDFRQKGPGYHGYVQKPRHSLQLQCQSNKAAVAARSLDPDVDLPVYRYTRFGRCALPRATEVVGAERAI